MNMKILFPGFLFAVSVAVVMASTENKQIPVCDPAVCRVPDCHCAGQFNVPGGLNRSEVPQFIVLSFDDAINGPNGRYYDRLLGQNRHRNPNGCPIRSTFFVSHEYTNYAHLTNFAKAGFEIASHTVTHRDGSEFTKREWEDEIRAHSNYLIEFGHVNPKEVIGFRAPHLATGGDSLFDALKDLDYTYDSSIVTNAYTWPYTLAYRWEGFECQIHPCPYRQHPSIWEIPLQVERLHTGGKGCAMLDQCPFSEVRQELYNELIGILSNHYFGERTPMNVFLHAAWLINRPSRRNAFSKFLHMALKKDDVYIVSARQLLDWVRNPVPLSQMKSAAPASMQCDEKAKEPIRGETPSIAHENCDPLKIKVRPIAGERRHLRTPDPRTGRLTCHYEFFGAGRTLEFCPGKERPRCPRTYPWVKDSNGRVIRLPKKKDY